MAGQARQAPKWIHHVVRAGSVSTAVGMRQTALPCDLSHCKGHLNVWQERSPSNSPAIHYQCHRCLTKGSVQGWARWTDNLASVPPPPQEDRVVSLSIPVDSYRHLIGLELLDLECQRLVFSAERGTTSECILTGSLEDLSRLAECITLEACLQSTVQAFGSLRATAALLEQRLEPHGI